MLGAKLGSVFCDEGFGDINIDTLIVCFNRDVVTFSSLERGMWREIIYRVESQLFRC